MTGLYDVEIQDVVQSAYVLLFEDTNVPINIQIAQVFLPLLKTDDTDNLLQHGLERLPGRVHSALDDCLVVLRKHFVLFEHHGSGPRTVVNCKVQDPFVRCSLADFYEEFF